MPRRLVNLTLLWLVPALAATGILGWALPAGSATALYAAHRILGLALLLALAAKWAIVRGSLGRRLARPDRTLVPSALASVALVLALGLGLAWTLGLASFDTFGGYSALNLHVFLAVALLPLVAWHLARRWEERPPAARLLSRRSALRLAALSAVAVALSAALDRLPLARRASGSKHAGSFSGNAFPLTSWLLDETPALDARTWRLEITGAVGAPRTLSLAELNAAPREERTAVLDCTAGWWTEQRWSGVRVGAVLSASEVSARAREVTVVSVTGHRWSFPLEELEDALLATRVGDEPLSPAHGFPVRLVAPGRRGFQWIKWVARIEVA